MIAIRGTEEAKDMAEGERATGTPNTIYDLSSVLFHALEGGASYDTYIEDAQREGDEELADFFRRVRDKDSMRADQAQRLIAERTPTTARAEGATAGAPPRPEPFVDLPDTESTTEETPSRAVERESATARTPEEDLAPPGDIPPDLTRTGEVLPRAGEKVTPSRTEEVPMAEEVPSGTPPQAPSGDVQRETLPDPSSRTGEALPRTEGVSPRAEEAPPPEEQRRAREQEDKELVDEALDRLDRAFGRRAGEKRDR
jgi:hypothetical protein